MTTTPPPSSQPTTCGSLLEELQMIWDETGETDAERDNMLLQLERDCLHIYQKRVELARKHKADMHQSLAAAEAEIANLVSALGEPATFSRIFAGAFPRTYEPPSGFYFEVNDDSPIVQDDITLFDYNVQDPVELLVAGILVPVELLRVLLPP